MRSVSDWGTHKCLIVWLQAVFFYIHFSFRTGELIRMDGVTKKKRGRPAKAKTIGDKYTRRHTLPDYEALTVDDLDCPICIEMVTEPVRLRCNHLLCRECFERLLELSTRKCPKCRRWIGGTRRISDWLDTKLWDFIRKKFLAPSKAVEEQIKSDRRLALNLTREERRERYFRRSAYVLRSSTSSQDTTTSAVSSHEDMVQ